MAYATSDDMVARFGEAELIRLSTPEGALDGPMDADAVTIALADASELVDSYIGRRFVVPLNPVPASIAAAVCTLARHALSLARNATPGDAATRARDETSAWLKRIAAGDVTLPGATPSDLGAGARVQDRDRLVLPETSAGY